VDTPPALRTTADREKIITDDEGLAETRIQFLTSESAELGQVRDAVLTSWWRSRRYHVPADHIEVPYFEDQNLDTPWVRNVQPVLHQLGEQLDGQPVSLILTDRTGVVVSQHTGDPDLHRHLESVDLIPGFSYGEQFVGTNGIGTALEDGKPMHVFGHEHYAEHLENLACAGVPIKHPISGKTIGAIDLTCWRKDAGGLLVALARSTAEHIRHALLTTSSMRELELFQAYLQACRRSSGIVMALNDDVVMMNDDARHLLDSRDQSVLLARAPQEIAGRGRGGTTLTLPSGNRVRTRCRPVDNRGGDTRHGVVLHVEFVETDEPDSPTGTHGPTLPAFVPGLVGSAPPWLRCCHDVDAGYESGEWLVLEGEPGAGKSAIAQCVHQRHNSTGRLHTCDAAGAGFLDWMSYELDDPPDALIIRHIDQIDADSVRRLTAMLGELRDREDAQIPWIAVTVETDGQSRTDLTELLALFPRTVHVPPLRYHIEDVRQLVPYFLNKLSHGGQLNCSPNAMQMLMRSDWPGNIDGLYRVLKQVTQHRRRTGEIQPADLPAEHHAVTRRSLNRLESMERDAIVQSLRDAHGNKAKAAKFLGLSRATIYRKIRDYGIVVPLQSG
jgi:transcriptional regulator of acetoin/glycerol metabolism